MGEMVKFAIPQFQSIIEPCGSGSSPARAAVPHTAGSTRSCRVICNVGGNNLAGLHNMRLDRPFPPHGPIIHDGLSFAFLADTTNNNFASVSESVACSVDRRGLFSFGD